jgi:RNA 2',3'-cyclic 3'-phosphodiesterase
MRLFIALDIDAGIRERIARFVEGVQAFAPDARWVRAESLHITLKFIGEKPEAFVDELKQRLGDLRCPSFGLSVRGFGFFPNPRAARVFWIGIEAGGELAKLAGTVDETVAPLGVEREDHAFSPHLTLARGGKTGAPRWQQSDGANMKFKRLQEKLASMPPLEFGTITAREYFVYESKLGRGGSQYTKIARFGLE